ncbi:MAG: HprK-related kinase B [Ketobacter sp.]
MIMESCNAFAQRMTAGHDHLAYELYLQLGDCRISVHSNSEQLSGMLRHYFKPVLMQPGCHPDAVAHWDIEIIAIECPPLDLDVEFVDWKREPGKSGRKDSFFDLSDGRLIRKVRTGMVFLISDQKQIAAGPCVTNDNQVINFINAQYMSWLQQRDWLICHASGLVYNEAALAIAGFSGGGKSTLMLHTLENPAIRFLTNDRLFVRESNGQVEAAGIPKLPRINPGTIVNNPRLQPMLSAEHIDRLLALPKQTLWNLEEKYDVFIEQVYGDNRIAQQAPLRALLILSWDPNSTQPMTVSRVDLRQRRDLLPAVMKSPGPFYRDANGHYYQENVLPEARYLKVFANIIVYEATGGVDFAALSEICQHEILS